jgi:hypothetical protein
MDLVSTIVGSCISTILFTLATISLGRLFGLTASSTSVGFGPTLLTWVVGRTRIALKPIPFGGFVKFRDPVLGDDYEDINPVYRLPILWSLLVIVGPPAILLGVGIVTYLNASARGVKIASLVLVWTGVSCLLPIPTQNGFAAIQRLTLPKHKLPAVGDFPFWFTFPTVIALLILGLVVLVTLCFYADVAIRIADGLFRYAPPN